MKTELLVCFKGYDLSSSLTSIRMLEEDIARKFPQVKLSIETSGGVNSVDGTEGVSFVSIALTVGGSIAVNVFSSFLYDKIRQMRGFTRIRTTKRPIGDVRALKELLISEGLATSPAAKAVKVRQKSRKRRKHQRPSDN